jgi:hypothetical protein
MGTVVRHLVALQVSLVTSYGGGLLLIKKRRKERKRNKSKRHLPLVAPCGSSLLGRLVSRMCQKMVSRSTWRFKGSSFYTGLLSRLGPLQWKLADLIATCALSRQTTLPGQDPVSYCALLLSHRASTWLHVEACRLFDLLNERNKPLVLKYCGHRSAPLGSLTGRVFYLSGISPFVEPPRGSSSICSQTTFL